MSKKPTTKGGVRKVTVLCRLKESNDLLRSAYQIAKRKGRDTGWAAFERRLLEELEIQHRMMYPEMHDQLPTKPRTKGKQIRK